MGWVGEREWLGREWNERRCVKSVGERDKRESSVMILASCDWTRKRYSVINRS